MKSLIRKTFVLAATFAMLAGGAVQSARAFPNAGAAAPDFSIGLIANGHGTITLSKLKGHGIYLNFFASWCIPCKAEVPSIAKLSRLYAKKGVVVIGVDELESVDAARGFVSQFKLPYPIGIDNSGSVGASYGLIGMPLHVFIGADGKVVSRRSGEMSPAQIQSGLDQIARR